MKYELTGDFSLEICVLSEEQNSGIQTIFSRRNKNDLTKGYDLRLVNGIISFNWNTSQFIKEKALLVFFYGNECIFGTKSEFRMRTRFTCCILQSNSYQEHSCTLQHFSGGMALDFGDNPGEFIIADGDEIAILNINGTVLNEFELISVGFPDGGFTRGGSNDVGYVRSLERDANGDLYGLDEYGVLGRLDLENETFTYITEFTDGGDIVTLFKLPENIFQ